MSALKVGDVFPADVSFLYVKPTPETSDVLACGIPTKFDASAGTYFYVTESSRPRRMFIALAIHLAKYIR